MITASTDLREAEGRPALRLSLSDVAALAKVRRPVASVWRTRFATGEDAFPAPITRRSGVPLFDAAEVADWLIRTGHGNNPEARADAAASATPADFEWADEEHVAELDALIVLASHLDALTGVDPTELRRGARDMDPDDAFLTREVSKHLEREQGWTTYADALIDAAYSPEGALEFSRTRLAATTAADGSAGALAETALDLFVDATRSLVQQSAATCLVIDRGIDESTAVRTATGLAEDVAVSVAPSRRERSIRRHLFGSRVWIDDHIDGGAPAVRIARVPGVPGDSVERMLADADDVALSLRSDDVAVIIGPARALIDALPPDVRASRDDVLRSGRLRAAVRLPHGLATAAAREPLALWILGPTVGDVPRGDRVTAVADLIDHELTDATRADLVSDVLAGMGSRADAMARTFRFARLVRTASLLARSGALLPARTAQATSQTRAATLAARLDAAERIAGSDLPKSIAPISGDASAVAPAILGDLVSQRHARIVPGTRLAPEHLGDTGLIVITAENLGSERPNRGRIDPLVFAQQHPSAQLSRPGDVIFRTAPTAMAWVDHEGSHVVAYPARTLRITAADPGGLVPELVAADIATQPSGPGAWKRWMLRRVAPAAIAPLRSALADITAARSELESRVANLDHYIDTLTAAVAAGAVTLTDRDAAPAASDMQ
ncbi:hypothetical protein [Microbacterium sp. C7(2022)]|uniref:hypothetical protein n=1 Tax=Microbacterium sp. C7(2022) TaxID=2992759 RepID=UPI00237C0692|nr:hypothetical protein [Microbacterium sp. C7(2022)]MDE0546343.1 hypothetical protein [Microbacterium sp. C7(2022)]